MYSDIANEFAIIQKKFLVPAKLIAQTFSQTPPWRYSLPITNINISKWTKNLPPKYLSTNNLLNLIKLHIMTTSQFF